MKKLLINIFKTLFFFDLAIIITYSIKPFNLKNAAFSALLQNAVNFAVIALLTFVFNFYIDKKIKMKSKKTSVVQPFKTGFVTAAAFGMVVPIVCAAFSIAMKQITFSGVNKFENPLVWVISLVFETIAAELLLRGYLFSAYKDSYGFITATVVTTLLYVSMSLEIFEMSKIFIINILLMNILLCFIVELTGGVKFSIITRFIYSLISILLLGSLKTKYTYPSVFNCLFRENSIISGGAEGIEGSVVTTVLLAIILLIFIDQKYFIINKIRYRKIKVGKVKK